MVADILLLVAQLRAPSRAGMRASLSNTAGDDRRGMPRCGEAVRFHISLQSATRINRLLPTLGVIFHCPSRSGTRYWPQTCWPSEECQFKGRAMTCRLPVQSLARVAHLAKINLRYLIFYGSEWINDRRYGIDTRTSFRGMQSIDDLRVVGERSGAHPYAPSPFGTVKRILKRLPADTSQYTFIDYGSGKGRVLLITAHRRFREVIGIEFAEELHRTAEQNISSFRGMRCSPVRSVLCDATKFELPSGPCVLFIYNSFEGPIMKRVADNVISSYLANPRHIMVIYYNPTVANAFEAGGHFRHTQTVSDGILSGLSHPRRYAARILEAF